MTYSIIARDPTTGALGAAAQSRFLAVGAIVPWGRADVGVVVTQARARVAMADELLASLAGGATATQALRDVLADEARPAVRQVGVIDHAGDVAVATGGACAEFAAHAVGDDVAALGNFLVAPGVPELMVAAFEQAPGSLARRLLEGLRAGQRAGGERRGVESASLLVVRRGAGFGGDHDREVDLRVDHDPDPIATLGQLLQRHELHFGAVDPDRALPLAGPVRDDVARHLRRAGWLQGPDDDRAAVADALRCFLEWHNLESRWVAEDAVDAAVLPFLRDGDGPTPLHAPTSLAARTRDARPGG